VQMEKLQNGDRFYYLTRLAGLNFLTQLEQNSFAELVMRNTDTKHLPGDVFSRPDYTIEAGDPSTWAVPDDPATDEDESRRLADVVGEAIRFEGSEHIVMGGTEGDDNMRADLGDDTLWGDGGDDRLEGGAGNDIHNGGDGDDIVTDQFGDDNIKGGRGHDAMNAGPGVDLLLPGEGDDFVVSGSDPSETFGGGGDDVINMGDDSDTGFGDEGDDWMEGGPMADLMQGGNGAPFQDDIVTGDDVLIGDGGNDDYDSEGGDDIMVTGPGIERNEGMLGFDWVTHRGDPQPARADMDFTGLQPPDEDNVRDRFDQVEGLSGWRFDDTLRGDSGDATTMEGHELQNAEQISLIDGLSGILGGATAFTGGNIILGGGGSDLIEGRGGDDVIDGDRWLDVQLRVPDLENGGTKKVDSLSEVQAAVFRGDVSPDEIDMVREIETPAPDPQKVDTAVFTEARANYDVLVDQDDPALVTVVHARGGQSDGIDTLRNIERLEFSDQPVDVVDITTNTRPTGAVTISDDTPAENQALTASQTIEDEDGIDAAKLGFTWEAETDPDTGEWTRVEAPTGDRFTPGVEEVGLRLRVVASYRDGDGVLETVKSAPTEPVANVNDAPAGRPIVDDATPTEEQPITAGTGTIADRDGLTAATFAFQWQAGDGVTWTNISGATNRTFTPQTPLVGRRLRVLVSYTDDQGARESVASLGTEPIAAAPVAPPAGSPAGSGPAAPVAPLAGSPAGSGPAPNSLALRRAVVPRTIDVETLAAEGLPVRFTAPEGTRIVRFRVMRPRSRRPLAQMFVRVESRRVKLRLRQKSIRRALARGGRFRIEMTPGARKKRLGAATVRTITVRR
jgi:RTX calcium-binding nonapeptide repeat (4 copies)